MSSYKILIVDDHSEVRRMLRSGLETLERDYDIVDIPSGEEALLEATRQPVHLLIADVRLAGMTGLELREKILGRNPQSKVILITGVTDPKIRQQVADAGADAFFIKPIPMSEFLNAVERCLGSPEPIIQESPEEQDKDHLASHINQRIFHLRQELQAISVVLVNTEGRVLSASGDLPDGAIDSNVVSSLLAACNTSANISQSLGSDAPGNLLSFEGSKFDLSLTHVGRSYILLVATNKGVGSEYLGTLGFSLRTASRDLLSTLGQLELSVPLFGDLAEPTNESTGQRDDEAVLPGLEEFFQAGSDQQISPEDVDAFWEELIESHDADGIPNRDAISYDQAEELGLTPDENDS